VRSLGDRMKAYEGQAESHLLRRLPVMVRIDGKAFHTFTSQMKRPYDQVMSNTMAQTLKDLCGDVSGCVYGYTQSDELTLLLQNDANLDTEPLFDNRVQKLASVIASMTTHHFLVNALGLQLEPCVGPALFDTRVFTVPSWAEAANCLIWRQQDATKNAISMAAQAVLKEKHGSKTAQKLLHGKNGKEQQELMFQEAGVNFNDYPVAFKRGISCTKTKTMPHDLMPDVGVRLGWQLNYEMPILRIDPEAPALTSESIRTWGVQ
jgi:tRNA(His) guanylyltransferase